MNVLGSAGADLTERACYLIPGTPAAGERGPREPRSVTKQPDRGQTCACPHLLFPECFTRPLGHLDSQPPSRSDHVEACRPRGFDATPSIEPAGAPPAHIRPQTEGHRKRP